MTTKVMCDQCNKDIVSICDSVFVQLQGEDEAEFCSEECLYIWLTGRLQDKKAINQLEEQE